MCQNCIKKRFIYISEPFCNTISIQTSGKSANINETRYDHVYGNYTFKSWDSKGFSVYQGVIDGNLRYLYKFRSKHQAEVWWVSINMYFKY
jgi:hypothetical protein